MKCNICNFNNSDQNKYCENCGCKLISNLSINNYSKNAISLVSLRCPNCNANLSVNSDLEFVNCKYCNAVVYINNKNKTKEERIINAIIKKDEKDREYYSSNEYKKRMELENITKTEKVIDAIGKQIEKNREYRNSEEFKEKQRKTTKIILIVFFGIIFFMLIIGILFGGKSDELVCNKDNIRYLIIIRKGKPIECANCPMEMLNELETKYNNKEKVSITRKNIEIYFENNYGYCGNGNFNQE